MKLLQDHIRQHLDAVVERALLVGRELVGTAYATTPIAQLRPRLTAGLQAVLADLESTTPHHYGDLISTSMEQRVREGFGVHDMHAAITLPERVLSDLCRELYPDPAARLPVVEHCHRLLISAQRVLFTAYAEVTRTLLGEQLAIIQQLSSPVIPLYTGVVLLPLIGLVDADRSQQLLASLLPAVVKERASVVILDLTGVPAIDADVVRRLTQVAHAARLLGARVVFVGISPGIARTMTTAQVDLAGVVTLADLKAGLEFALAQQDLTIQPRPR